MSITRSWLVFFIQRQRKMAHIWSDDLVSGTVSNGTWELSKPVNGARTLIHHWVDETPIPWIFAGIDEVVMINGAAQSLTVSFGDIALDRSDPAVLTVMEDIINAAIVAAAMVDSGWIGVTMVVTYDETAQEFVWTFSVAVRIDWTSSSGALAFNMTSAGLPIAIIHNVSARYAESRPHSLEVTISNMTQEQAHSRTTDAHIVVPMNDYQMQTFQVEFVNTKILAISWARVNAPGVECPIDNQWELVFQ